MSNISKENYVYRAKILCDKINELSNQIKKCLEKANAFPICVIDLRNLADDLSSLHIAYNVLRDQENEIDFTWNK